MIRSRICNLRTPDWHQVDRRCLLEYPTHDEDGYAITRTITPWQRYPWFNFRSYIVLFSDGGIYVVFFTKE